MAEIISFPGQSSVRAAAIRRLAVRLCAHLTVSFYKRGIHEIPVQPFVKDMEDNLLADGIDYNETILDNLLDDPETLARLEAMFIRSLKEKGYLPADFKL